MRAPDYYCDGRRLCKVSEVPTKGNQRNQSKSSFVTLPVELWLLTPIPSLATRPSHKPAIPLEEARRVYNLQSQYLVRLEQRREVGTPRRRGKKTLDVPATVALLPPQPQQRL